MGKETREGSGKSGWNRGALSRAAVLATAFVALAALLIVVIPGVSAYQDRRARYMCAVSLERAKETVLMEYLEHPGEALDEEGALAVAGATVLCPSGGDCYLIPDGTDEGYSIICALHDTDSARRLRLNARSALIKLRENLRLYGADWDLSVILNGVSVKAGRVEEIPGSFPDDEILYLAPGSEVIWFYMAQDGLYAVWTPSDGWTGGVI